MAWPKIYYIYDGKDVLVFEGTTSECTAFLECSFGTFRRVLDTCEYYHGYLVTRKEDMEEYEAYRKRRGAKQ